jgi:hypothetical protein
MKNQSLPDGSRALRDGEVLIDTAKVGAALASASITGAQTAMADRCGVQRGILRRALGMDSHEPWAVLQQQNARQIARACGIDLSALEWTAGSRGQGNSVIDGYLAQFRAQLSADLGPLVPLTMQLDGARTDLVGIVGAQKANDILQLVGPSGTGKTYLLAHLALRLIEEGVCPILLRATHFRGDAVAWAEQAVSRCSAHSLDQIVRAARVAHLTPALLIDAVNETPKNVADDLPAELQRMRNLHATKLILTGHAAIAWPAGQSAVTASISPPDSQQKIQLVEAHLGRPATDAAFALDAIATPHDAMIWASVFANVRQGISRHGYYAAFAREKLGDDNGALQAYRALALLARQMRQGFVYSTTEAGVLHAIERSSASGGDPDAAFGRIAVSGLVPVSGGYAAFRHEQFQTFFAAEDLLTTLTEIRAIIDSLKLPVHAELREFVLGALTSSADIESTILALGQHDLIGECLVGHCGGEAQKTVRDLCHAAIDRLVAQYCATQFDRGVKDPETGRYGPLLAEATAAPVMRPGDRMLVAAAAAYYDDALLDHLLAMFASIDRHIEDERVRLIAAYPDTKMAWRGRMFNAYYHMTSASHIWSMQQLLQGRKIGRLGQDERAHYAQICARAKDVNQLSIGQLWFVVDELHTPSGEPAPDFLYDLAERAWRTGLNVIRYPTSHMLVMNARHLSPEEQRRFAGLADSWLSDDDFMLNSSVMDVLKALDALEDQFSTELALQEYEEVLAAEPSGITHERAFTLYCHLMDHPFESFYCEAYFERLDDAQRAKIRSLAIQTETRDSMLFQFLLTEVARHPEPSMIPVLQEVATAPDPEAMSTQDAIIAFKEACRGLAGLGAPLAEFADTDAPTARWHDAAHILWHFFRPDQTAEAYGAASAEAWDRIVSDCAIDVPMRLLRETYRGEPESDLQFAQWSRGPFLALSRTVLAGKTPLASSLKTWPGETLGDRHKDFAIEILGLLGDRSDLAALIALTNDAEHGRRAISAARDIEAR